MQPTKKSLFKYKNTDRLKVKQQQKIIYKHESKGSWSCCNNTKQKKHYYQGYIGTLHNDKEVKAQRKHIINIYLPKKRVSNYVKKLIELRNRKIYN